MTGAVTHLYFVGAEGLNFVKVGRSKNPEARVRSLRRGSPYKLRLLSTYENDGCLESYVLTRLRRDKAMHGEWFLCDHFDGESLVAEARHDMQRVIADNAARVNRAARTPRDPSLPPTLGDAIKQARIGLGWKQKDLHERVGLSQKYLSQIENDRVDPHFGVVQRIAKALQVSLDPLTLAQRTTQARSGPESPPCRAQHPSLTRKNGDGEPHAHEAEIPSTHDPIVPHPRVGTHVP